MFFLDIIFRHIFFWHWFLTFLLTFRFFFSTCVMEKKTTSSPFFGQPKFSSILHTYTCVLICCIILTLLGIKCILIKKKSVFTLAQAVALLKTHFQSVYLINHNNVCFRHSCHCSRAENGHSGCGCEQPQRPHGVVQLLLPWKLLPQHCLWDQAPLDGCHCCSTLWDGKWFY